MGTNTSGVVFTIEVINRYGYRQMEEVAINLPEEEMEEYREIFSFFDRDGGGTITSVELGQVMRTFGWNPTEGDLQEMIGEIDQDGNGCITFNEFVTLMTKNVQDDGDIEEEIREAFRVFDREGHGFITVPDLTQVLTSLGDKLSEDESRELVEEADIDGDGNVNYEEFVTMLLHKKPSNPDPHAGSTNTKCRSQP